MPCEGSFVLRVLVECSLEFVPGSASFALSEQTPAEPGPGDRALRRELEGAPVGCLGLVEPVEVVERPSQGQVGSGVVGEPLGRSASGLQRIVETSLAAPCRGEPQKRLGIALRYLDGDLVVERCRLKTLFPRGKPTCAKANRVVLGIVFGELIDQPRGLLDLSSFLERSRTREGDLQALRPGCRAQNRDEEQASESHTLRAFNHHFASSRVSASRLISPELRRLPRLARAVPGR